MIGGDGGACCWDKKYRTHACLGNWTVYIGGVVWVICESPCGVHHHMRGFVNNPRWTGARFQRKEAYGQDFHFMGSDPCGVSPEKTDSLV